MANTETAKLEFSRIAEVAYKALIDQLNFLKRQQWIITNYMVLVLAGIFATGRAFSYNGSSLTTFERILGTSLAVLTFAYGLFLLILIQRDLGKERLRCDKIVEMYVSETDRENLGIGQYHCPFLRGITFLIALIGVSLMAMAIAVYSLWR